MQNSTKLMVLMLMLFCAQLSNSAHSHVDKDSCLDNCSVCLVGQNAEFDDALVAKFTNNFHVLVNTNDYLSLNTVFKLDNKKIKTFEKFL